MSKKSLIKVFTVILLIIYMICITNVSFADNFNFSRFENKGNGNIDDSAKNIMGAAVDIIRVIGTGVAVIMLVVIAIKYMTVAPSEKAEFKKVLVAYIVGAIILFASTNILAIIFDFAEQNVKTS